jgi:hypothetical protein
MLEELLRWENNFYGRTEFEKNRKNMFIKSVKLGREFSSLI